MLQCLAMLVQRGGRQVKHAPLSGGAQDHQDHAVGKGDVALGHGDVLSCRCELVVVRELRAGDELLSAIGLPLPWLVAWGPAGT